MIRVQRFLYLKFYHKNLYFQSNFNLEFLCFIINFLFKFIFHQKLSYLLLNSWNLYYYLLPTPKILLIYFQFNFIIIIIITILNLLIGLHFYNYHFLINLTELFHFLEFILLVLYFTHLFLFVILLFLLQSLFITIIHLIIIILTPTEIINFITLAIHNFL